MRFPGFERGQFVDIPPIEESLNAISRETRAKVLGTISAAGLEPLVQAMYEAREIEASGGTEQAKRMKEMLGA